MNNLTFLRQVPNDDLIILFDLILKSPSSNGKLMDNTKHFSDYLRFYPGNIKKVLPYLIYDLRLYGGWEIDNYFRGIGPSYSDLLREVAESLNVSYNKEDTEQQIEESILRLLFIEVLSHLDDQACDQIIKELNLDQTECIEVDSKIEILEYWDKKSEDNRLLTVMVNSLMNYFTRREVMGSSRSKISELNELMAEGLSHLKSFLWYFLDISEEKFRITVPSIILIAYLRQITNTLTKF